MDLEDDGVAQPLLDVLHLRSAVGGELLRADLLGGATHGHEGVGAAPVFDIPAQAPHLSVGRALVRVALVVPDHLDREGFGTVREGEVRAHDSASGVGLGRLGGQEADQGDQREQGEGTQAHGSLQVWVHAADLAGKPSMFLRPCQP